ncbi:HAD family hydrolase [Streptomyces sp. MB09-02B]|uniref:HAD family hydrolase n=1 Tax=Streptomyces sp. MB09-02B TaxID=3028667 RepID=UPI0029BD3D2E|nr:HAD family hydrolase [Streptomyces sp. MB09-02B]MDX3640009.1 HAD family hydrolase [Streptomyces sp. MB09-02B]
MNAALDTATSQADAHSGPAPRADPPALMLDSGGVLMLIDGEILADLALRCGVRICAATARHAVSLAARDRDLRSPHAGGADHSFEDLWSRHAGCPPELGRTLWDTVRAEVPDTRLWSLVNPEAVALLDTLPPHVQRYVVSNADGEAHAELANAGLLRTLDGVLDSSVVGIAKPDPRIFRMAAVALGRPLHQCVYVADTLDGAPAHLPRTILYDPLGIYPDDPERYARIRSLAQLAGLIRVPD